jgi:hypothetical protein
MEREMGRDAPLCREEREMSRVVRVKSFAEKIERIGLISILSNGSDVARICIGYPRAELIKVLTRLVNKRADQLVSLTARTVNERVINEL